MKQTRKKKTNMVLGCKPWTCRAFDETLRQLPGVWNILTRLQLSRLIGWAQHYISLLHWSWKVSDEVVGRFECVCFHITDVPFGRGGSPLQNLIVQGSPRDEAVSAAHEPGNSMLVRFI
jgi:methionyl-tRNA formyltransferase